ncbi:MAG: apolipoprotein N-acyltransferase [Candidatus Omnitrophota bacterium]
MLRKINQSQSIAYSRLALVKPICLCLLSAALLILSFPRYNIWVFAWFGFVPLLFVIRNKSKPKAFLLSYLTGVIFWSVTIYWLVHVTLPGTIILILYLSLYFGIFGLIYNLQLTTYNFLTIPALWVSLEYARSHLLTGFPWALLGYSQYLNLPVIQIADITGVWGVSFLVMMVNVLIKQVIGDRLWVVGKRTKNIILLPILLLALSLGYGYYRLYLRPKTYDLRPIRVSVVQGNIPQELKWETKAAAFIVEKYSQLSKEAARDRPDLIIWPEASSPGVFGEDTLIFEGIFSLAKTIKSPLLIGSVSKERQEYFNSALLIDSSGKISERYDKIHLVPFGEYIPLKKLFPFLQTIVPIGDIAAGEGYSIFKIQNRTTPAQDTFSVLICFEDLFPEISREFVKRGAGFLVNITNDAWYKKTAAAHQHFQASVFRAVENRVFLARSANSGVSGFISPTGEVISLVKDRAGKDIFVGGFDTQEIISRKKNLTFYTRYGDLLPCACLLLLLCAIIARFLRKR